jgi:hypothetical protein
MGSLLVASYNSQGYGWGIRPRLHMGEYIFISHLSQSQSQNNIATDGQSVCLSWYRAPAGAHDQMLVGAL